MDNKKENLLGQKIGVSIFAIFLIAFLLYVKAPVEPPQVVMTILLTVIMTKVTIWPKPKTKQDLLREKAAAEHKALLGSHSILDKALIMTLVLLAISALLMIQTRWPLVQSISFVVLMLGLVSIFFFTARLQRTKALEDRRVVASEIGLSFSANGDPLKLPQLLRSFGKRSRIENVFSGMLDGFTIQIFDYIFVYTKNIEYRATMLEIITARTFPTMMILSRTDNLEGTIAPKQLFDGVPVQLEGNFSDHFSVYVARDAEDDVRLFLTPDIMATLIDDMPDTGYFFTENKVYVVITNNNEIHFRKELFIEEIAKVRFILSKWSPILSRNN
jgi:hypothetical protein